jgi:hypothetical protein
MEELDSSTAGMIQEAFGDVINNPRAFIHNSKIISQLTNQLEDIRISNIDKMASTDADLDVADMLDDVIGDLQKLNEKAFEVEAKIATDIQKTSGLLKPEYRRLGSKTPMEAFEVIQPGRADIVYSKDHVNDMSAIDKAIKERTDKIAVQEKNLESFNEA